ncbi:MAG: M81 family metallopeptidase [Betaproteobacteria bacterium]
MRVVIAMMKHETNTFSPLPTPLANFGRGNSARGPAFGDEAIAMVAGTNNAIAAFLDLARTEGWDVTVPIAANAVPSGLVDRDAFEAICAPIVQAVKQGCDAVMLDLHGAMVVDGVDDPEGELLARIRMVAPGVPVAVAFDFHGNFSPVTFANADIVTGYCTYPHIDMYETGCRAGRTLLRMLAGEVRPGVVWRRLPMLTHMNRQTPAMQPMKDIMDRAMAAEASGEVLNASVFGGFPLSDIPWVGLTVAVIADADRLPAAQALVDELSATAWQRREDFVFASEPMAESIAHAKTQGDGPVVLADHGDNVGAGGVSDDPTVLAEVLRQGLTGVIAGPYVDPASVAQMIAAGVGSQVTIELGGKTDMPAVNLKGAPLRLTGTVQCITDGRYTVTGPMMTGTRLKLGRTAVLDVGAARVVVCELPQEPFDTGVFTHCGLDPARARYVLIKSRQHFRAGFAPLAKHIVLVAGPGVCISDYSRLPFVRIPRPLYPLDPDTPRGW